VRPGAGGLIYDTPIQPRVIADLWGRAAIGATATQGDWALFYQELLAALARWSGVGGRR
jgi:hypothetical protein